MICHDIICVTCNKPRGGIWHHSLLVVNMNWILRLLVVFFVSCLVASLPSSSTAFTSPISTTHVPRRTSIGPSSSSLYASFTGIDHVATLATSSQPLIGSTLNMASDILSTDNIKIAFSVATFFPQLPWLFLILLPNTGVTKKLLGGYGKWWVILSCMYNMLYYDVYIYRCKLTTVFKTTNTHLKRLLLYAVWYTSL